MASARDLKVGVFTLIGLLATGIVIFIIGRERKIFDAKIEYRTTFKDVQGLKAGAPVRLSGVDIGDVTSVTHGPDASDDRLYITVAIVRGEASRVREDSIARVANKGLLGDKMLEITPGTPGRPPLAPKSIIGSEDPADYTNLLSQVGNMARKADGILSNVEKATAMLADDRFRQDIEHSLRSVTTILDSVAGGKGYVGRLLSDPAESDRLSRIVANAEHATGRLDQIIDGVNAVIARVNDGPGFVHEVLYSRDGSDMLPRVAALAGELEQTFRGIRESKSLVHGALYGDPQQDKLIGNVVAMSDDLRGVVAGIKAGKGTVGGLLMDPSVYEDAKAILGNVQRNDVLRALVRYSIKQDEKKPAISVSGEKKP